MNTVEKAASDMNWDANQLRVIQAESSMRLIVEAGPGTGKTAVACARLAHLINEEDVEPSNTWMISFTRTAVAEIRARLHSFVGDASFAIRIATIDSHAWSIHSGHDPNAKLTKSYEENIARVIALLKSDEDVADELSQIEHVVIDEAQDLVGLRADLVEELIKRLSLDCGITIFADEAQAIYDFSDDSLGQYEDETVKPGKTLLDRLRTTKFMSFKTLTLKEIYRTSSLGLRKIFSGLRKDVLDRSRHRDGFYAETEEKIKEYADQQGQAWSEIKITDFTADHLILFRTRAEVLMASQFCDTPHRLRLSGYGTRLPPWLALCFFDYVEPFLAEHTFFDLWSERLKNKAAPEYDPADAWRHLLRVAGKNDGAIDMRILRRRLSQARPPVELAAKEYGLYGPIVGTIHASKGREARNVVLVLPCYAEFENIDAEIEETRVIFVGATRAKTSLRVVEGPVSRTGVLPSGRVYGWTMKGKARIEIGCDGDITARGLVGRSEFSAADASSGQAFLAEAADAVTTYKLESDKNLDWCYRIKTDDDGPSIGVLSNNLTSDLWTILRKWNQNHSHLPPRYMNYIRSQGSATIVLGPDDSDLEWLHEPWASSGFVLTPRIAAFPTFRFYRLK